VACAIEQTDGGDVVVCAPAEVVLDAPPIGTGAGVETTLTGSLKQLALGLQVGMGHLHQRVASPDEVTFV
jgi:hypothetical protein